MALDNVLIVMKQELLVTAIIFILLFIKLGKGISNNALLSIIQLLLLLNVALAFTFNQTGRIFDGMYVHNHFLGVQKGILAGGVYLISLLCTDWLRKSEHRDKWSFCLTTARMAGDQERR